MNDTSEEIRVALFDVDETLLSFNSMHSFIMFFFHEYYGKDLGIKKEKNFLSSADSMKEGVSREQLNKLYYNHFKNVSLADLKWIGEKWLSCNISSRSFFNNTVLDSLEAHRQIGFKIILVSGGFFASLEPLSKFLNTDACLCVSPAIANGKLTGEIASIQTIGVGKSEAVLNFFAGQAVDWKSSFAYGDHISDMPMLTMVGNPVVVGENAELIQVAKKRKWKIIH